ncbi:MAG: nuclear transport factor 2 family protein [Novosphingobium sp.]|jgi:hypothetical protein|nr:nuclear transport factor 2 family protein [Novosphingobium sp.]
MEDLAAAVAQLRQDVAALKAEAAARRVLGRYMFLCDSPLPEGEMSAEERAVMIGDLFTEDAIWEGVGGAHGAQFGRHNGPAEIAAHMGRFYAARDPRQVFNTHYVCSEQVQATAEGAEGQWVQFQPWIHDDGTSILRSSRLHVFFRETPMGWKIARYRTENLFIADLPNDWTKSLIAQSVLMTSLVR